LGLPVLLSIAILLLVAGLKLFGPRSSPEIPSPPQPVVVAASPPAEAPAAPPAATFPAEPPPPPPNVASRSQGSSVEKKSDHPAADVSLVTAEICRTFSTAGSSWKCAAVGDSIGPGPLVLYTRIKSSREAAVVHRWYRGDVIRQSVQLTIHANTTEGYRTYSRQTVDRGDWRVEVRNAAGALIHEQRFTVR